MSKLICTFLALLLLSGCTSRPKNIDEMVQQAELGDPSIQSSLAKMYSKGIGTSLPGENLEHKAACSPVPNFSTISTPLRVVSSY